MTAFDPSAVCAACLDTYENHAHHAGDECGDFTLEPLPSPEERAERASRRYSTDRTDRAIFKAGYLAALKEKP